MKKSIIAIIGVMFMICSCGNANVTKDVKSILADGVKLAKIESVNITSDFYTYTHEYIHNRKMYEYSREDTKMFGDWMRDEERDMKYYKSLGSWYNDCYKSSKKSYEEYKAKWENACKELEKYANIDKNFINNGKQSGKLYVAKVKGKDKITGKYLDFYSYQIFTYDSDGTIHPIDADNAIQIVCSVFPNAKKDLKKAMEYAGAMVADALANLKI